MQLLSGRSGTQDTKVYALEHKGRHIFKCFLLYLYPAQGPTHLPLQCGFDECVNEEKLKPTEEDYPEKKAVTQIARKRARVFRV